MTPVSRLLLLAALSFSPPTVAAEADRFVGTWFFDAMEVRDAAGHWVPGEDPRWGRDPIGFIRYDAEGNMSVQIMRRDRAALTVPALQASDAEQLAAFRSYVAYFGTYRVLEGEGVVVHYQVGNLDPQQTGTEARRGYTIEGDVLTLIPDPNRRIHWRKR